MQRSTAHHFDAAGTPESLPLWQRLLLGLLIFVFLMIPLLVCKFVEPFHRGFFCDDATIRYPYNNSTITNFMVFLIAVLPNTIILALGEFHRLRRKWTRKNCSNAKTWLISFLKQFVYFLFGLLLVCNVTEMGKFTIGSLRPHFMAVCQPQLKDGTTCNDLSNHHRYIDNYNCLGIGYNEKLIKGSRLSFPSGHSSVAFYAFVYTSLYLQKVMHWRRSYLKPLIQFILVLLACFIALTRIMDRQHHSVDVFAGSLIGVFGAFFTVNYASKLFKM